MDGEIEVFCGRDGFSVDEREIAEILRGLKARAPWKFPAGMLSVAFLGDAEICRLHKEFLDDPAKTDVITFPGDEIFGAPIPRGNVPAGDFPQNAERGENCACADCAGTAFAGEICVCVDQALRSAAELKNAPADELLLYLVHGWLHLAGFDDISESDRAAMRAAEQTALSVLRAVDLAPLRSAKFPC